MILSGRSTPLLLSLLAFWATPIVAQNLLAGAPSCAQQCAALIGSSQACAVNTDPLSCFCGSNSVLPDQSTTYCADGCFDPTSQQQLVNWFEKKCSTGGSVPTTTSTSPATTTAPTVPGATTTPPTTGTSGSSTGSGSNNSGNKSWWDKHARWIAMVIVLIVGFSIIIAAGIYFKRRYDRKQNYASSVPATTTWGPNTSQFRTSTISEEGYGDTHGDNPPMQERTSYDRSKSKRSSRRH